MTETERWLSHFAAELERGTPDSTSDLVARCFAPGGYWRDLIAFTWNIVTLEGRAAIGDMLTARLADVRPGSFRAEARDGWFTFETAVGRGRGKVALKDGKMVMIRIPYPMGFYAKGFDGRIDDPNAGWKGRGLWSTNGDRTPWLMETGKGSSPRAVHIQILTLRSLATAGAACVNLAALRWSRRGVAAHPSRCGLRPPPRDEVGAGIRLIVQKWPSRI